MRAQLGHEVLNAPHSSRQRVRSVDGNVQHSTAHFNMNRMRS